MDRHPISREPGGHHPSALPRAAAERDRGRHRVPGGAIRRWLAQRPHRVLRNKTVETWEAAGRPPSGARPGEGEVIARSRSLGEIVRYQSSTPGADFEGDIDALSLFAGQGVGLVSEIKPAGDIVREIVAQAQSTLAKLAQ